MKCTISWLALVVTIRCKYILMINTKPCLQPNVALMPKADLEGMNLKKVSPEEDHIRDSAARTKSINLAFDPKEGEKLAYVGEQLNEEDT